MKQTIDWLKEVWKDSKKRSVFQLCLWFLFLIIVFALVSNNRVTDDTEITNGSSKQDETKQQLSTFETVDNYEYSIEIEDEAYPFSVYGTYQDSYYTLIDGNDKYTYKKGVWTVDGDDIEVDNPLGLSMERLNYNSINEFISTLDVEANKEEDSTIKREYKITAEDFNYYYSDLGLLSNDDIITISIEAVDNYITIVKIDLSDCFEEKYIIKINYKNHNKLSE